jgi:hypothetical protein
VDIEVHNSRFLFVKREEIQTEVLLDVIRDYAQILNRRRRTLLTLNEGTRSILKP